MTNVRISFKPHSIKLFKVFNITANRARERVQLIRKSIPTIHDALHELHTNPENLKLCEFPINADITRQSLL